MKIKIESKQLMKGKQHERAEKYKKRKKGTRKVTRVSIPESCTFHKKRKSRHIFPRDLKDWKT